MLYWTYILNTLNYIPNIVSIDLSGNKIANIDDNAFQGLNRISQLDLSYNSFMTLISKNSFRGSKTLENLNFEYNNIKLIED